MTTSSPDKDAAIILNLAQKKWDDEKTSDFSTLRRIPSTSVRRFLAFYRSLTPADRARWTNLRLKHLPFLFLTNWKFEYCQEDKQWLRQRADEIVGHFWGWKTWGLRDLKGAIGFAKSNRYSINIDWIPSKAVKWLQNTPTAKANLLRRLIKPALKEEFGLSAENRGGGEWGYGRSDENGSILISIDFGSMGSQLRYDVNIQNKKLHVEAKRLTFETIMGVTCTGWNWITEDDADKCVLLLIELIKRVINFTTDVGIAISGNRTVQPANTSDS